MSDNVDDFLFGGSGMAAKFEQIGDTVEGVITDAVVGQQTHMETKEPLTWTDGSPRKQLVITIQTDEKSADDDGLRRIFAKGGSYEVATGTGTSLKDAIGDAVKKAGAKSLTVGGRLKVGYTGEGKKTNRGFSAPKLYRATYEAPVKSVSAEELWDE
jgi:hypothetical protein